MRRLIDVSARPSRVPPPRMGTERCPVPLNLPPNGLILAGIGGLDARMTRRLLIDAGLFAGGWLLGWLLTDSVMTGLAVAVIFSGAAEGVQAAASHDE